MKIAKLKIRLLHSKRELGAGGEGVGFSTRNNGQSENNGYRQSLGLFISASVSPRQEELEVCPVCIAPTGPELGGR